MLATIFGIAGGFAVWVNRQALNTSNWASTSGKILANQRVQTALSAYLVRQLFANVNLSADLKQICRRSCSRCGSGRGRVAAARRSGGAETACQSPGAGRLGSGQHCRAQRASEGAERRRTGRLNQLRGRDPQPHQLVTQLAATLGISSQVAAVQSKLQGSTGAAAKATAQNKLGITLPSSSGQLVILRSNQLKTAQDIANAVKHLAIVLPAIAILLFALAVYLARGRRRRTLRTSGWCWVLIGVVLVLIRRVAGDAIVNGLVKVSSNKPAVHDVWNIATSLLYTSPSR